jgi:hypothetical protein
VLPFVTIEMPADSPVALAERVVRSCNAALAVERCRLEETGTQSFPRAIIRWDDQYQSVTVELRSSATQRTFRRLRFGESDPTEDRWSAAGILVAVLATEQVLPNVRIAPVPARPAPQQPAARPSLHVALDLGAVTAARPGSLRFNYGLLARSFVTFAQSPWAAHGGVRFAARDSKTHPQWLSFELGPGLHFGQPSARLQADASALLVAQRFTVRPEYAGHTESAATWRAGARLAAIGGLRLAPWLSVWAGLDLAGLRPTVEVEVAGQPVATEGPWQWAMSGGVRLLFPPEK